MFTLYCDDSGTHPKSDVAVSACCISTVEQWTEFKRNWDEANQRENFGVFHMADFVAKQAQFSSPEWNDQAKRDRTIQALINLIKTRSQMGFSAVVVKSAYDEVIVGGQLREKFGDNHYAFAVRLCTAMINRWREKYKYGEPMRHPQTRSVALVVALAISVATSCRAQEVASIDLTKVAARTELRRPPSTSGTRQSGGIAADYRCSNATNSTGVLRTALVSLDRSQYQIGDEPTFEVTVKNVGSNPLKIPFSPDLADLQPEDPAQKFGYFELRVSLWVAAGEEWAMGIGEVHLYGAEDHANTTLTLRPGEWVRITGKDKLRVPSDGSGVEHIHSGAVDHAYAQVSIYQMETLLTPTSTATVSREICLRQTRGKKMPITITAPEQ